MNPLPRATTADIALLLEGTYPYVSGGVSNWVDQLIRGFPEYRFACVFLGGTPEDYGEPRYVLPDNVVHVEVHYLHGSRTSPTPRVQPGNQHIMAHVIDFHTALRQAHALPGCCALSTHLPTLFGKNGVNEDMFLHSQAAWDYLCQQYQAHSTDPSFVDYFWTVRSIHRPLWLLQRIAQDLIPVSMFHTISTGYAGFLGALLKQRTGRPLLLTEHGIYTKERKIDLMQSEWLADNRDLFQYDPTQISYFRDLWIRFFASLGRICYDASDHIVSLFEANRQRQIEDGAQAEKTRCIPNGIAWDRFSRLYCPERTMVPPVLCLIGRVVPMKDIKTFIRAMRIVLSHLPEAEAWIAGPQEENPNYVQECKALAASLGIADKVKFLGLQNVETLLPQIGLTVLSSISEGLPLVVLESLAAGVPVVATDVGACRELIEGKPGEDHALGPAGAIVPIADPAALARASLDLLRNTSTWHAASKAGRARVEKYYRDAQMLDSYRALYKEILSQRPTLTSSPV